METEVFAWRTAISLEGRCAGWNQKRPADTGRTNAQSNMSPRRPYVIAARAVAPNRVAPTEAVTSDTSANAISSFIAFIPDNEHMYNLRRAIPSVGYIGYTSRLTPG